VTRLLGKFLRIRKIDPRDIGAISSDYRFQSIIAAADPDAEQVVFAAVSDPHAALRLSSTGIVVVRRAGGSIQAEADRGSAGPLELTTPEPLPAAWYLDTAPKTPLKISISVWRSASADVVVRYGLSISGASLATALKCDPRELAEPYKSRTKGKGNRAK
jgi:hypothetical protein